MESITTHKLQVSQLIISKAPIRVSTVLGSCVSTCIYSRQYEVGGITHYALPYAHKDFIEEEAFHYGNLAIPYLIDELLKLCSGNITDLEAKLIGGANSKHHSLQPSIGSQNIEVAKAILKSYNIPIVGEAVGGTFGKKLLFDSPSGRVQVMNLSHENDEPHKISPSLKMDHILCIGASTGGTEAIREIITSLPEQIPPVLVVQHIPAGFSRPFAQRLNSLCSFEVKEAEDMDEVRPSRVLIAPGGMQMKIERFSEGLRVRVLDEAPMSRHKPSVDYLFNSVAEEVGRKCLGVILTGMGADGTLGLKAMKSAGAFTIAQDENSSVVFGMPKSAIECGAISKILPLEKIGSEILSRLKVHK